MSILNCRVNCLAAHPEDEKSGGGEIRTHETFRPSGFQDRRNQPLCHPSGKSDRTRKECAIAGKRSKGYHMGGGIFPTS
jgi:hypothetical protein